MSAQSNADSLLAAVRQFHEKAAEDEKTQADLAAENATLRRLLHIERQAVHRYQYRLRLIRQGVR